MTLGLIWAQAANGVIGNRGRLPWHLPEDLARFKALTLGATVVMGRATWESLPDAVRPLPGRRNLVLSRRGRWAADGAEVVASLEAALAAADGDVWVVGGASVYAAAMGRADRLEVTELAEPVDGDVRAPGLDPDWQVAAVDPASGWLRSRTGLDYRHVSYRRPSRSGV